MAGITRCRTGSARQVRSPCWISRLDLAISTLSKEERRVIREVERAQKFARLEEEDDEVYEEDTCPKKCSARQVDKALKTMQLLAAKKAEMMARAPSGATAASSASEKGKDTGATEAISASEKGLSDRTD